jgi:hypothetical protein
VRINGVREATCMPLCGREGRSGEGIELIELPLLFNDVRVKDASETLS